MILFGFSMWICGAITLLNGASNGFKHFLLRISVMIKFLPVHLFLSLLTIMQIIQRSEMASFEIVNIIHKLLSSFNIADSFSGFFFFSIQEQNTILYFLIFVFGFPLLNGGIPHDWCRMVSCAKIARIRIIGAGILIWIGIYII